ncbi:MAG: thioether cross-link-forming SCIFF peptide maturase [Clostridia bacterium]|nr:thioether cross-link-forming SCIFF peptide maturase [Clostridia bacterium]
MIHAYKHGQQHIVLDVNSGAVHIFDPLSYDMLAYLEAPLSEEYPALLEEKFGKSQDALDSYADIYELYQRGELFSEDDYIDLQKAMPKAEDVPIKALCLNIAHDCNLRCGYCFASTGDFGCGRKLMPFEVGKAAFDFLVAHSGKRRNLEVDFFGGEPLMNFGTVKMLVAYARELEKKVDKKFRFTLTTNAMLLNDEVTEFLNKEMHNVVLSLDGRKEVNDFMRQRVDGTGCFDTIMPKIRRFVEQRGDKDYYVRGTFTKNNLDFASDVRFMVDQGFEQISIEPVVCGAGWEYSIGEEDLPRIKDEYDRLADQIIADRRAGKFYNFFHFMIDLQQGPCVYKRIKGCGAGGEYIAVTPEGDIYPCHQFVGNEAFKLGNVMEQTLDRSLCEDFVSANVFTKEECSQCWAKYYCSGGCCANNYAFGQNIKKTYRLSCELEKKRVECAIAIQTALSE